MKITRHFESRCAERAISKKEVQMALEFGISVRDKRTLGQKSCLNLIAAIENFCEKIEASKKTGVLNFIN